MRVVVNNGDFIQCASGVIRMFIAYDINGSNVLGSGVTA